MEPKLIHFFEKILLGVSLAAPIGPVTVEMIRRGLRDGFMAAFSVRLGGAFGNFLCLLVAYFGLTQMTFHPQILVILGSIGACLLIFMGIKVFTVRDYEVELDEEDEVPLSNGLRWGLYLAIVNPVALVFWPGIFAASIDPDAADVANGLFLNLFIIVGVLLWGAGLSLLLAYGHRYLTPLVIKRIGQISALSMLYFGLKYLWVMWERL